MANELVNPYANPYLPSFVNQRPRMNEPLPTPQMQYSGVNFGQIHSVRGFEGARAYNLANGSSEILAEEDPNLARVYIVAKDANGQMFVQGANLVMIDEPKPVTMDDLSTQMSQILDRLNKLEADKNDQPVPTNAAKNARQFNGAGVQSGSRNGSGNAESGSSNVRTGDAKP